MIKNLIKDLTFDNINLSKGLGIAKLIAYQIENDDFKNWINHELNGYTSKENLPLYRVLPCEIYAVIEAYGQKKMMPLDVTKLDEEIKGSFYKMEAMQSVETLEYGLKDNDGVYGFEDLPMALVGLLREISGNNLIVAVKRRIQLSQVNHIINVTKQKLIDTLLELDKAFPNLEDNFKTTKENLEKTSTIVNNYIYGSNVNSNVGVGENLSQNIKNVYTQKIDKIISELGELGVPQEDLAEVKDLVKKETDKVTLGKKLMNWVGKMTTKGVEKGIELQIPMILEKIQQLL